jgi:hypothetical protein
MSSPQTKKKSTNPKEIPIQDAKLLKKIELLEFENEQLKTELRIFLSLHIYCTIIVI